MTRFSPPFLRRAAASACLLAALGATPATAEECRVPTADFCVCCPPSDCRKEASFCPGGTGGLLLLKAKNPTCSVNPFDDQRCRSGGVVASEQTSAVGVYVQGQRARVELSGEQLDGLVQQLEALR